MISVIKYHTDTGLIVMSASGTAKGVGDQPDEAGYEVAYGIAANCGQYYNAATGLVSDAAPVPSTG